MADKIPDSLIDDILESARKYSSDKDVPEYSVSDVDKLLASLGISEDVNEKTPVVFAKEPQAPVMPEPIEIIEPSVQNDIPAESEAIEEEKALTDARADSEFVPVKTELKLDEPVNRQEKKTSGFLDFIKKSNVFTDESSDVEDIPSSENVSLSEAEDGQIELQIGGEEISSGNDEAQTNQTVAESVAAVPSVSGQISIEKTRMFNEVKIHGEYNPNISHNLGNKVTRTTTGEGEALSTPVMGEEKYRKHFMNKPVQNLEKTQEHRAVLASLPSKTLETPGIIVKKNKSVFVNTDGFEAIPTIVPAESEIREEYSHSEEVSDGQIMLEGFGEEETIEKTTEEEAEARLLEARKEAVREFVDKGLLFKQEVEEEGTAEGAEIITERRKKRFERNKVRIKREFFGPKDSQAVIDEYYSSKKKTTFKLVLLSVICAVMALMSAAVGVGNGDFEAFGGECAGYVTVELFLLLICCAVNFKSFKNIVKNIKNIKPTMDLVVVIAAIVGILQTAVAYAFAEEVEATMHLFTAAAVVPMILKAAGELTECRNDLENFYVISEQKDGYYTVENIEDEDSAAEIARGLMLGEPEIKYSAKVGFPRRFVELSREADVTPSILKYSLWGVSALSLIVGVITMVIEKNVLLAVTAFAGAFLMSVPAAAGIISAASLAHANKKLRADGTVINGYSAVENAVNSNGIIIDSADAFKSGGCNIEGIKLYHKMRIDEAILYTASVVIASGGVLSEIFDGVIEGKKELLLPTETLAYEEKLGCSCWIHNHRVLVGNRELLKHHNVELPEDGLEEKFREAGKNTLYLAIEGKIAAMFIVVYKADEETAHYIRALERDGVSILFRTSDANITEGFLENEFGLPKNVVKIINPVAGEMFTKLKNAEKEQSDAEIIHDGRVASMLKALHLSFGISQFINVSRTVQTMAAVIGILLVAVLSFMSGLSQVSAWQIIIYQIIWGAFLYFFPAIKKPNKR